MKALKPATASEVREAAAPEYVFTATEAQNEFGSVLEKASQDNDIVITRHGKSRAVLISVDRYDELMRAQQNALRTWSDRYDEMLVRMQGPAARAAATAAFNSTPEALGVAAVRGASAASKKRAK